MADNKPQTYKATVSAEFSSVNAAAAAMQAIGAEKDFEGRAKARLRREGKDVIIDVEANDAPSCRAALNSMLRLVEMINPLDN